jgi:hypothetical protein
MRYTKDEYKREVAKALFPKISPSERRELLGQLPVEERLSGLSPDEVLRGFSAEEIEAYLHQIHKRDASDGDATRRN